MQFFVGIDVSLDSSSICIIDERGVIIKEGMVDSHPTMIARFIRHKGRKIEHIVLKLVNFASGSTLGSPMKVFESR